MALRRRTLIVGAVAGAALAAGVAVPGIAAGLPSPATQVVQDAPGPPDDAPVEGRDAGPDASSHGARVSEVARDKSGDVTNHGQRVSEVARQNGAAHRAESASGAPGNRGNAYGHDKGVGNPHGDD